MANLENGRSSFRDDSQSIQRANLPLPLMIDQVVTVDDIDGVQGESICVGSADEI